jgi:hypothetical protein
MTVDAAPDVPAAEPASGLSVALPPEGPRELVVYDQQGADHKTIALFRAPRTDLHCFGILAYTGGPGDDQQWVYVPRYKRIRQVNGILRQERFAGTDLTYQDLALLQSMGSWSEADADSELLGEESLADGPTYQIELRPRRSSVPYARIVAWLDKTDLEPRRLDLFPPKSEEPRKRITLTSVRLVSGIPFPFVQEVETSGSRRSRTRIDVLDVRYEPPVPDYLFERRALENCPRVLELIDAGAGL